MTSLLNTTTLQEHSGEKQARNTLVRRMSTTFKLKCNQIKDTTPITMASHQQQHDNYSDKLCNQAITELTLQEHLQIRTEATPNFEE